MRLTSLPAVSKHSVAQGQTSSVLHSIIAIHRVEYRVLEEAYKPQVMVTWYRYFGYSIMVSEISFRSVTFTSTFRFQSFWCQNTGNSVLVSENLDLPQPTPAPLFHLNLIPPPRPLHIVLVHIITIVSVTMFAIYLFHIGHSPHL